jgi:hypothetical protein
MKKVYTENYRLVAFKTCRMKMFLSLNLLQTITVDGVEYPVVKWRSLELLTFFTLVKTNLSILQDVTSSKLNMLNTLNNFNLFQLYIKSRILRAFFITYSVLFILL